MEIKKSFLKIFVLYMIFWVVLAEKLNFEVILVGMFITTIIAIYKKEGKNKNFKGRHWTNYNRYKFIIGYLLLLIKEIFIASIEVAKIVLSPKLNINPSVIKFKTKLKTDLCKTILANSITLTPGTLTIEVKDDEFTVHCIAKNQIDDVMNSKFEELLLKIEE